MKVNEALAEQLRSAANLLAARSANPYRVRAYRRAAETLAQLEDDVTLLAQTARLELLPGIGRELAAKIREFLASGQIRSIEELKAPLPPEVASWTTLPGFSESLVHYLYYRLGIRTLDDLDRLVRSHLLRTVPGMRASDEDLLAAITARHETGPRS